MIPKRIIQVWGGGRELPLLGRAVAANLRLLHPDFEYVLFDDAGMRRLVDEHGGAHRATFDSFALPIQRYDFFRYLAVHALGGFYFDVDVVLARGLHDLLQHGCVFPFERLTWTDYLRERHAMDWEIGNYAFGAEAGHPFLAAVLRNCARGQADPRWRREITRSLPRLLREDLEVIYGTGPGLVSRTLAECGPLASGVTVLFPEDVRERDGWDRFGDLGIHLGAGTWRKHASGWRRRVLGVLGRRNEARALQQAQSLGPTRSVRSIRAMRSV